MKTKIGEIKEIWRYPVKSMGGSIIPTATVNNLGMIGDRGWTLKDRLIDEILSAKRVARIMQLHAAYTREPKGKGDIPAVIIRFPDGNEISSDHPDANPYLSAFLIKAVKLSRLQHNKKHYRKHNTQSNPAALRHQLGLRPGDNMGGLASIPISLLPIKKTFVTPPHTHYDIYPLHVLTTSTLHYLQKTNPDAQIDVRRFRPSFLIDTHIESTMLIENKWAGGYLEIGSTVIKVEFPTLRCSQVSQAQPGLKQDNKVAAAVNNTAKQFVGAYASVIEAGDIKEGDAVVYKPASSFTTKAIYLSRKAYEPIVKKSMAHDEKQFNIAQINKPPPSRSQILEKQGFRPFLILQKTKESADITSFYLDPLQETETIPYLPGQHIVLALDIPGRESPVIRSYSLSRGTIVDNCYRITVQRELASQSRKEKSTTLDELLKGCDSAIEKGKISDGLASNFLLDHVKESDQVYVKGPLGQFFLAPNNTKPLVLIGMGVGITPLYSILEHSAKSNPDYKTFFFYGTQNQSTHLFKKELARFSEEPTIEIHTAYSQASTNDQTPSDYQIEGRLKIRHIQRIVDNPAARFYLCGSQPFMEYFYEALVDWGVEKENIHYEYFKKSIPLENSGLKHKSYTVFFTRSDIKTMWSPASGSLLDLAEENGIASPFGCRYGVCEACRATLMRGSVEQDDNIADLHSAESSILLCSTRPNSDIEIEL